MSAEELVGSYKSPAEAKRPSIAAPRDPSPAAKRKRARHRTGQGTALTSFRDLLRHLATQTLNSVTVTAAPTDL